ncbi:MAG: preprotein translocase subunit SecE [Anaerolineae bacterium]|nr:preprotein translocase subunit SecE [Anaerolineae bacterium]MDW8102673.1 preprotein translocase subunit SecE [Anaerolineae bacterium]
MPKGSESSRKFSLIRYLKETRAELRKVTWPTREEALRLTVLVIVTILVMAILLGLLDYIYAKLMDLII